MSWPSLPRSSLGFFFPAMLACSSAQITAPDGGDGAVPDVPSVCPISSCLALLRAVQAACPVDGVACQEDRSGEQINDCFANGVQLQIVGQGDVQTTVWAPSGRLCYVVLDEVQLVGDVFTVTDAAGAVIIREYYHPGTETTFGCPDGTTLTDGPDHPCGVVRTLPESRNCVDGACVRS